MLRNPSLSSTRGHASRGVCARGWLGALALVSCLGAAPAWAQITEAPKNPLPDPSKFARGLFADAEIGSLFFLGEAQGPLGAGVALGARVGYDVFRWLAVQAHVVGSTHRTDFGAAPQSGQLLQIYQGTVEVRLTIPIRQLSIFVHGGAGLWRLSTNILGTTNLTEMDDRGTFLLLGGAGLDYHLLSRHFSCGLAGQFQRHDALPAPGGILVTSYLRHTF